MLFYNAVGFFHLELTMTVLDLLFFSASTWHIAILILQEMLMSYQTQRFCFSLICEIKTAFCENVQNDGTKARMNE